MKLFLALFALVAVAAAQLSNEYLPPNYGGDVDPEASYAVAATAPGGSYDAYESAPAHSYSDAEGYRYKTHRRRVFKTARRHRREVSTEYLPPAASAPSNEYLAPEASYSVEASAPVGSFDSFDSAAAAPAHSFSDADGYRYKTHRRRVFRTARRHRREVSAEYLPPAASAPSNEYLAPEPSYSVDASAPVGSFDSFDDAAAAPAHSYSDAEGYRYKTHRRRVFRTARRHRREVSAEYLPPAASAPSVDYLPPAASAPSNEYLAPAASYSVEASAPGGSFGSFDSAAAAPAHSFSDADGYRYKTHRRRVFKTARRHRREVSAEYLPPAASAPSVDYLPPAASAPSNEYLAPAASYSVEASAPGGSFGSFDSAAAAPAHSFSDADGYRYKTHRRRVFKTARRHRREVSSEYLPPAASAPAGDYAAPAASYASSSYSTPAGTYSIEAAAPGGVHESYETAGAAPAHSFSPAEGYRYKTVRRRVIRRRV